MPEVALLTDEEFLRKLKELGKSGRHPILEGFSEKNAERVIANGRTQQSDRGVALIIKFDPSLYEGVESFAGFFGNYNPETGELTDFRLVVSDDLWAVRRACLLVSGDRGL